MTENEIRDILAEELPGKPTGEAIMAAHHRVGLCLLEKFGHSLLAGENGDILRENAYADSKICTFLALQEKREVGLAEGYFDDLLLLYRHWAKILSFFLENYEKLDSARFKQLWPPDTVLALRNLINERYEEMISQYLKSKSIDLCLKFYPYEADIYVVVLCAFGAGDVCSLSG